MFSKRPRSGLVPKKEVYMFTRSEIPILTLCILLFTGYTAWGQEVNSSMGDQSASTEAADPGWPRTFQKEGGTVVLYQPQVDTWSSFSVIQFRAALALTPEGSSEAHYGVLAVQADTVIDHEARMVMMTNLDVAIRFPGLQGAKEEELKALVRQCLPQKENLNVSLDRVLACLQTDVKVSPVNVNLAPPPIFYSDVPAILVNYMGSPQFKPVAGTKLMFAVNTNWVVLMDMKTSQYYLLDDNSWLVSSDPIKGPWAAAGDLPAEFSQIPAGSNWDDVRKNIPGEPFKIIPRVLTSTEPAELLVTDGSPEYSPLAGTRLMYVSNPEMPLFLDLSDSNYYYLVSGRWFRAADINGPWSAASADLPAEFAKIPDDSPVGYVLASIPKTQEAQDAILLASVPHKATVNIQDAKLDVAYDGPPKFVPIQDTSMTYAVNTSYQVVSAENRYYCCYQGVWFQSSAASGPWGVCTTVPAVIYTIPPASPVYNVTYVKVYDSTPDTVVVVGYTSGYSGEYVAATGALMFGAGMAAGALLANNNDYWYSCSPCYYSYGCGANYSYAYGGYYRGGGAYYGPHGGAGWGSAYNPATGAWARAGYASGPGGQARWGAQAYNPFTNTYAQHSGGTNGYQSWGKTAVSQDGKWTQAGHVSGASRSAGYAETSTGKSVAGVQGAGGGAVAKTGSGDVYAGRDGNVYKKSDGQWQKYQGNGNWENTSWNKSNQADASSAAQNRMTSGQNSMQNRPAGEQGSIQNRSQAMNQGDWQERQRSSSAGGGQGQNRWSQQETSSRLNQDSWSRQRGNQNAASAWGSREGGGWGGRSEGGGGERSRGGFGGRGGSFRGGRR
jgi:hypothetical protein